MPPEIMHFFTWSKNGKLVRESSVLFESRFVLQSNFSLLINNVEEEDEGNYSCYIMSNPPVVNVYVVEVRGKTLSTLWHYFGICQSDKVG